VAHVNYSVTTFDNSENASYSALSASNVHARMAALLRLLRTQSLSSPRVDLRGTVFEFLVILSFVVAWDFIVGAEAHCLEF